MVADNIDHTVQARVQTKDHTNRDIHWTHQYAMKEKVIDLSLDDSSPQKQISDIDLMQLLPDGDVIQNLVWQWAVLVSRVVSKYLPAFKSFRKDVIHHIPHQFSEEMSMKSEIVRFESIHVLLFVIGHSYMALNILSLLNCFTLSLL